jgi:DNA-binding transcriptional LysR family regulator
LPAIITELHAAYPDLTIELMPSNRIEDLLQREADIAVRMQRPSQGMLIARRIGDVKLGMYAHKDYLARRGKPVRIDDLAGHALIGFDKETAFIRSMKTQLPEVRRELLALRTDSDLASLAMLRAGFGIGYCQIGLARRNPDLVRLFPKRISLKLDTWLAMHEDLRNNPSCKVAFAALNKGLEKYVRGA